VSIGAAQLTDVEGIVQLDCEVIGNTSRRSFIENAIKQGRCIIVKENDSVVGFLIYDINFFECTFISLIIVSPAKRRRGYGSQLLDFMVRTSPTQKVFSSTNRSNHSMQKVFEANGFVESGIVENLDEGDPEIIYFRTK
jgi:ribosomal protein S18 acetylase RimI-like enzyme